MQKLCFVLAAALVSAQVSAVAASVAPDPKDPQYQAKGDQHRAYIFPGTGQAMPYRLYVPRKWNKEAQLPLMVILHSGASEDVPFDRGNGALARVAEERGYVILSPHGYRPSPKFNSPFEVVPNPRPAGAAPPAAKKKGPPPVIDRLPEEMDVLYVTDLVQQEYNVPKNRIYLFSNSIGGAGVWYLGEKYPDRWAAIGVASAPIQPDKYPFERLKTVPMIIIHGDHDEANSFAQAQKDAELAKEHGVDVEFLPVKGGTHLEAWTMVFPQMLDFFDKHPKK